MIINGIQDKTLAQTQANYAKTDLIFKTIGKRKCAVATLMAYKGKGNILINGQLIENYFQYNLTLLDKVLYPFKLLNIENEHDIFLRVSGGGLTGQAEAIQLAISKAFASLSQDNRFTLKKQNLLTRNSRIKERKKYGLKKARKASQFSKR